jgi:hypothetical protein
MSETIGYVVWDRQYGLTYRGHVYEDAEKAAKVLAGIVWHSRARYEVRPICLGDALRGASRSAGAGTTGEGQPMLVRGDVLQERPRADAEGAGQSFQRRDLDAVQGLPGHDAGRSGLGQAGEGGELVGVLDPAPRHVALDVPSHHGGQSSVTGRA